MRRVLRVSLTLHSIGEAGTSTSRTHFSRDSSSFAGFSHHYYADAANVVAKLERLDSTAISPLRATCDCVHVTSRRSYPFHYLRPPNHSRGRLPPRRNAYTNALSSWNNDQEDKRWANDSASWMPLDDPTPEIDLELEARRDVPAEVLVEPPTATPRFSILNEIPPLPMFYIRDIEEANTRVSELEGPLGFDMEWKVSFQPGAPSKTALIQVSDASRILLIQLSAMSAFPESLKELLESDQIVKAGVGIHNDARKLAADYSVAMRNCVELSWLSRVVDPPPPPDALASENPARAKKPGNGRRMTSLAKLVLQYTGRELDKGPERVSDWEVVLSKSQQIYAANDCHAGLSLYLILTSIGAKDERNVLTASDIEAALQAPLAEPSLDVIDEERELSSAEEDLVDELISETTTSRRTLVPSNKVKKASSKPPKKAVLAYQMWHDGAELEEVCARLRSPEKPLKASTVRGYILEALKSDLERPYSIPRLRQLMRSDGAMYFKIRERLQYVLEQNTRGTDP